MFGIISVAIFMDHNDNIFLIKSTKRDKDFPLETRTSGTKLDEIKLSGKSKNQLIDIIYDTQRSKLIQREITLNDKSYLATSILLDTIINNINVKNHDLFLYPPDKTIIIYFSELDYVSSKIKDYIINSKLSSWDFLKLFGVKNFILIFLLFEIFNYVIGSKLIEPIVNNFDDIILNYITGD